jgi:cleavage and polyadenylation specificity factor subunit 1
MVAATDFLPQVDQGSIQLIDPDTWTITDTYTLDPYEVIMCVENMSLETSEHTHSRSSLLCVGTGLIKGEDINAQGGIYVLDVIDVVPEPGYPETGRKFKQLARHKDKGAVTAISQVGSEGFILAAHGQKCMVRGLKEDNTLLPVAFMDTQCYVSVAKELRGTGLCLLGDAIKGLWLAGYTEDPYHLKMFGKSAHHLEVSGAEFLPDGKGLCIILADAEANIHVLRFDPHSKLCLEAVLSNIFRSQVFIWSTST